MSISDEVQNLQTNLTNSYTAVQNKGGTLPQDQCFDNLPTAIGSISTGGTIETLNVTPTTSAQTITATGGVDGYNPVNVSAVTSSIDQNITSTNIKSGVSILGINGSVVELNGETKSVSLTNSVGQTFTPTSPKNAITSITVTPNNQARTVTPTTSQQSLSINSGYSGNGTITVNAVTSSIDNNIQPSNIKRDVVILGTTGTYEGSGGIGPTREVSANGTYKMPASNFTFSLPSNATNVGQYALRYALIGSEGLIKVDLSSLTTISGMYALTYAFSDCIYLTKAFLSNLTTISGSYALQYAFNNDFALTSVDLSSLTTISGSYALQYAFYLCMALTSVDLSSLTTVSGSSALSNAFRDCYALTSLSFPALKSTSFGSYTNQFNSMLSSVTGCTVHFPSNLQSVIGSWSSVTGGFGGTNTTVLFDLPATT